MLFLITTRTAKCSVFLLYLEHHFDVAAELCDASHFIFIQAEFEAIYLSCEWSRRSDHLSEAHRDVVGIILSLRSPSFLLILKGTAKPHRHFCVLSIISRLTIVISVDSPNKLRAACA